MPAVPSSTEHHHLIDRLAVANGLVSGLALYPQVVVTLISREVAGLSVMTFLVILVNSMVWVVYAHHRELTALVIASALNCIASFLMILATLRFA